MIHSRPGAMRQYVARPCVRRVQHQAGNANPITDCDTDGFRRRHESILAKEASLPLPFEPGRHQAKGERQLGAPGSIGQPVNAEATLYV
jgi:hypothetical protein